MAEDKEGYDAGASAAPPSDTGFPSFSLNIWPPLQRTREALIQHMAETLSTHSVLSKRYGVLSPGDASSTARNIEGGAFATAASAAAAAAAAGAEQGTSVDDEVGFLEIYSKEISSRMIKAFKERGSSISSRSVHQGRPRLGDTSAA